MASTPKPIRKAVAKVVKANKTTTLPSGKPGIKGMSKAAKVVHSNPKGNEKAFSKLEKIQAKKKY
jgi:hypothetical protein